MPPLHQASAPTAIAPGGPVIDIANDKSAPPPSALDLLKLGIENAKMGQLNAAADVLAQSILKDPQSAEAHDALATVLLALDNIEYACKAKAKAVGLGNNSAADWELLGDMFVALGQADDAAQAFGTALALQPGGSAELERK
ncbi:MAG: tetratricopeptide repeat protein, partial [Hyphomicrobium denitrificans]|nr:tetratricopeptide repeat protein [Hyphomicrobium denitrificans]